MRKGLRGQQEVEDNAVLYRYQIALANSIRASGSSYTVRRWFFPRRWKCQWEEDKLKFKMGFREINKYLSLREYGKDLLHPLKSVK